MALNVSRITDYLFISTRLRDEDLEAIRELDVRLIVGMIAEQPPPRRLAELNVDILWLGTFDFFLFPIPLATLYRGVDAALPIIREGHQVLVYCQAGRHRSVAMGAAILIGMGHTADEAVALIIEKRPVADPGAWHIRRQIRRFEKYWHQRQMLEEKKGVRETN
ncbi:MAG TPA: dual specificity protein phosphatase [Anaerolineae bacterium]|nr:dual specificity protein phosphatase [Anaerolineae bacterium]